jgi:hypothetical protein
MYAWWYGFAPTNAGRNEWWMLMIRRRILRDELRRQDLHVAGEHDQIDVPFAAISSLAFASASPLVSAVTGR